jgi:hypothetical protein
MYSCIAILQSIMIGIRYRNEKRPYASTNQIEAHIISIQKVNNFCMYILSA